MTFSKILDNTGNIEMGWKSFSFIGLSILGTGQTLATFQLSENISLSIDKLIMFTIGEVIFSATGLMNFTGMSSKPLEQSFLSSHINLFTSVNVYDKCAIRFLFRNNRC